MEPLAKLLFILCLIGTLSVFALAIFFLIKDNPEEAKLLLTPTGLVFLAATIVSSTIVDSIILTVILRK